uniref:hypothetical protein n=1 Tax=Scandinavium goeteborgense TaxID=1851514 RepID=UPI00135B4250|nr:hypothetical protein [Scandinavium goeteborgense]
MNRLQFIIELIYKVNACKPADVGHYIMHNFSFINSNKKAQPFLKMVRDNVKSKKSIGLSDVFLEFVKEYLLSIDLKIIFIGTDENYADFISNRVFMDSITVLRVNITEDDSLELLSNYLSHPESIVVYDRDHIMKIQKIINDNISYWFIPYSELKYCLDNQINRKYNRTAHHFSLNCSLRHYLISESVTQVIVGSSYPWAAFPQEILEHSSNISMHCADINFSKSVLIGLQNIKPMQSAVLLLSPYDLFYELSLSRNIDILSTFNALESFCREHGFEYKTTDNLLYAYIYKQFNRLSEKNTLPLFVIDSLLCNDAVQEEIFKRISWLSEKSIGLNDPLPVYQQKYRENDLNRKCSRKYQAPVDHNKSCEERATKHSRHFNYKESFPRNLIHVKELVAFAEENNVNVNVVMSPFPERYLQVFNKDMVEQSRSFFNSIQSDNFRYIDLLENSNFKDEDFYDGDHLNFSGAEKLCSVLREFGLYV